MYDFRPRRSLLQERNGDERSVYALIDLALAPDMLRRLDSIIAAEDRIVLFEGTFAAAAAQYSPVLADLRRPRRSGANLIDWVSAMCAQRPLLTFIVASAPLPELAAHLRHLLAVRTFDGQEFALRFADPRTLPAVFAVLDDAQRRQLLGPIETWIAIDHHDRLIELNVPTETSQQYDWPLTLSEAQFAALLDRTAVYAIVAELEESYADFSAKYDPAERIDWVQRQMQSAARFDVTEPSDIKAWCVGALLGGEAFHAHPQVARCLQQARQGAGRLFDLLLALSDTQWEDIRTHGTQNPGPNGVPWDTAAHRRQ
jgi:Domain of unknown function (DUF4123)